jgi:general secretion pathway protein J
MSLKKIKMAQKGFTLLELVIAIGVFAILSALAYGGLNSILNATTQTREASSALQDLQMAIGIIQQDFSQITPRSIRDEFGEPQPAVKSQTGIEELIQFTRRGWRNPIQQPRSTLQRVAYRLEEKTLIRKYWRHLDLAPNPQFVSLPLLEGIEEITLQFHDKKGTEPIQSWPPIRDGDTSALLPRAIEITLMTERWGEVTRLIPLLEPVTPTATKPGNTGNRPGNSGTPNRPGPSNPGSSSNSIIPPALLRSQ